MATGGKAAIVTGAASGLGRAMALGLADNGIDVVAVDQNASALAALATAMTGRRGSVLIHPADLAQPDAFDGIVAAARERFGRIDILVNTTQCRRGGALDSSDAVAYGPRYSASPCPERSLPTEVRSMRIARCSGNGDVPRAGICLGAMLAGLLVLASVLPAAGAPAGQPIRIGSTLALTGPLGPTALLHKIAGEVYVEELNRSNGLLGRPVEWIVLDDQSKPEVTRSLYEKLITVDKVDLLMGPYATGAILAAMGVAQRYQRILPHHSFGMPHLAKYEGHFPTAAFGPEPNKTVPTTVFSGLATAANPPKTVAILTSKFPSAQFLSSGAKEVAEKRGLRVVLYLEYEFGTRDWAAMAARVKDAKPDLLWVGALGLDGNQLIEAMKKLDYMPPRHFHLFPAPGPLALSPDGKQALSVTVFEEHPPFMANPKTARLVSLFREKATKANVPYANVDTQVAGSFAAWQVLDAAVTATKSLDDKVLVQWLRANPVDTIIGTLRFDGPNNYGDDLFKLKQVQDGKWVVVWPSEFAAPGAKLQP